MYLIRNTITGKAYIGKTGRSLSTRWKEHVSNAFSLRKNPRCRNTYLSRAIRKHGQGAFESSVLSQACSDQDAGEIERFWVVFLKAYDASRGYNLTLGGEGALGHKHSPATRALLSASHIGHKQPPEVREKIRRGMLGRKHPEVAIAMRKRKGVKYPPMTPEHKKAVGEASRNRVWTPESRAKVSARRKGQKMPPLSPEHRAKLSLAQHLWRQKKALEKSCHPS